MAVTACCRYAQPVRKLLSLALVCAIVVAGCGGDDDGGAQGGTADRLAPSTAPDGAPDDPAARGSERRDGTREERDRAAGAGLARVEFVQRADRICRDAQASIAARARAVEDVLQAVARGEIKRDEYRRRTAALTATSAELATRAVARISALPAPGARRDGLEDYLRRTREQAARLAAQAAAQRRGDQQAIVELNRQLARATPQIREAARRFGFEACGGG